MTAWDLGAKAQAARLAGQTELAELLEGINRTPADGDGWNQLGTAYAKLGDVDQAVWAYRESISLDATSYKPHANLATVLTTAGMLEEARESLATAVQLAPALPRLHLRLGQTEHRLGNLEAARAAFERALKLEDNAAHRYHLGRCLVELQRPETAAELLANATDRDGLGILLNALHRLGRDRALLDATTQKFVAASNSAQPLLELLELLQRKLSEPVVEATALRGIELAVEDGLRNKLFSFWAGALGAQRRWAEIASVLETFGIDRLSTQLLQLWLNAVKNLQPVKERSRTLERALLKRPEDPHVLAACAWDPEAVNAGLATSFAVRALARDPNNMEALARLGLQTGAEGFLKQSVAFARRVLELGPSLPFNARPMLWRMLNDPESSATDIAWETRAWAAAHLVQAPLRSVALDRSRNRKLRLGFVSGDLRFHAVEKFARGMLRAFDRERFELICYSTSQERDGTTEELSRHVELKFLEPSEERSSAEAVAQDKIDVLIDLAGLTDNSGLPWMGFRPAPVQVTFLGYPATTGCAAIDVRLTDLHADPTDLTDTLHSERLVRLKDCAWNFAQPMSAPRYSRESGQPLIFGSFNRAMKLTQPSLAAWARILKALPSARLLIKTNVDGAPARDRILSELERGGAAKDQVLMLGWTPTYEAHQLNWNDVDIALDSFPYAGTTTTCEALLMGVPVVSLAGAAHVSRVGVSLLAQVELSDLVAQNWDDYVAIALRLAADEGRRRQLRAELPLRVRASMLGDEGRYSRELEATFRRLFDEFLNSPQAELFGHAIKVESQPPTWLRGIFNERGEGRTLGRLDLYDPVALAFAKVLSPGEPVHAWDWDQLSDLQVLARNHPLTVSVDEGLDQLRLRESLPPTQVRFCDRPEPGTSAHFGALSFVRDQLLEPNLCAHVLLTERDSDALLNEPQLTLVRPVPELGLLVPAAIPSTSQSVLLLGRERVAALRASGRLIDDLPSATGEAPVIPRTHESLAHLEALGLAQAKLPLAVAFFLGALESTTPDAALSFAKRALGEALSDFADKKTVGSALTLGRVAISLGQAHKAVEALQWVTGPGSRVGTLGEEAFLPCHPRYVDACLEHPRPVVFPTRPSFGFSVFAPDPIPPESLAEAAAREQVHPVLKADPVKRWLVQQAAECLLLHCLPHGTTAARVMHTFLAHGGRSFNVARIFGLLRLTHASDLP